MLSGSLAVKADTATQPGPNRIQPWNSLECRGALRRARQASIAVVLMLACSTGLVSDLSSKASTTTASLLKTPVGRAVVVDGVAVSDEEILWLARAIYSETKRPHEQELVAWIVRNRVDTRYRGNTTYRDAVLDPYQFSAFNPNTRTRGFYVNLDINSTSRGFQTALAIAARVATAGSSERPFSISTRHFYSARSMVGNKVPAWAEDKHPVRLDRDIDAERFRFYERIA